LELGQPPQRNVATNNMKKILLFTIIAIALFSKGVSATDERIIINKVSVKNFLSSYSPKMLQEEIQIIREKDFDIGYVNKTGLFLIRIYQLPVQEVRQRAEERLLHFLDIKKEYGCALYVIEVIDDRITDSNKLEELPISFCPKITFPDLNGDKAVNGVDYALVALKYGRIGKNLKEDLNNDGVVNSLDLSIVLARLGEKTN
jgi:hypothetical protein